VDRQLLNKNLNFSHNDSKEICNDSFSTLSKEVLFEEERLVTTITIITIRTLKPFTNPLALVYEGEH